MSVKPIQKLCAMLQTILIKITVKRLEKKFTQSYMASQLGISQSYYNKIENGKKQLTVQILLEIAPILNADITELLSSNTQSKTNNQKQIQQLSNIKL